MSDWSKRTLYAWAFQLPTYIVVNWVTGMIWLAAIAGVVSFFFATADWDTSQRRKAAER